MGQLTPKEVISESTEFLAGDDASYNIPREPSSARGVSDLSFYSPQDDTLQPLRHAQVRRKPSPGQFYTPLIRPGYMRPHSVGY
jgi:hypothetical protein